MFWEHLNNDDQKRIILSCPLFSGMDDTELREEFQKAIDELMADGTIENIAKKYKLQDLLIKK